MRPVPERPGPGQESVWDYPRPPRLESTAALLEVELGGVVVASTRGGWRVLETSHPPTYYLPASDFLADTLRPAAGSSLCEWKGQASYYDLTGGSAMAPQAGWCYLRPSPGFEDIAGAVAVMAGRVDRCWVDGEEVVAQPGGFYGGWITNSVAGPFKGIPGSMGW